MSSGMVPLELSKDNNQYCKISVFMPNAGSINESVISVTNVGGDSFSVAVSMIRWNANKVFCKLINGTKISNINMYYTVDTERFCFYIKANWYAKIIVSRLGLVNTSKIESINAIPSGAIEVPISWRDKRYSTELGELIPLATNEANGLMSKNNYIKIAQSITSTKLIKIESWDGYSTLVFIRTSGATGLYSIDGNWADSAKFTRLSGPLGKDHFNAYRERNGNIYVKTTTQSEPLTVTSVGSNHVFKFEESDKDVDSLIVLQWSGGSGGTGLYRTTRFLYQRYGSPIIPINRQQAEILV